MDFNTLLLRLGIDPDCFENRKSEPVRTEEGFIYEVYQRTDIRECPYCRSMKAYIQDYEASGGDFQALLRWRSRIRDAVVVNRNEDGDEEYSIFY